MFTLYEYPPSGNSYKVHLLLHLLELPHKSIHKDILKGETRTPEFLEINPAGRVPVLKLPNGNHLAESSAIMTYLADGTPLFPSDNWTRANILKWLFFEQNMHETSVAEARFWLHSQKKSPEELGDKLKEKHDRGHAAIGLVEKGLEGNDYLVGGKLSIADIGLYAYTHVADEGGFDLSRFPNVNAWIERIAATPNYIPLGS